MKRSSLRVHSGSRCGPRCWAVALVLVAGCSFAMVDGPPNRPARSAGDPGCEENTRVPTVDAAATGVMFLGTLMALAALTQSDVVNENETRARATAAAAGGFGVLGVVFGYSAKDGFKKAKACSQWKARTGQ